MRPPFRSVVDSPASLADLLETIAVLRRGKSESDYGFLKDFVAYQIETDRFFSHEWLTIRRLALEISTLFPSHSLPILDDNQTQLVLSRNQAACLVVHQFLCTLDAPTWQDGFQDFHIWYSAEQPHEKAVRAYLTALFEYFSRLSDKDEPSPLSQEWPISYSLHTNSLDSTQFSETKLSTLKILKLPDESTSPSVLGLPDGAGVISANKFIGFGRTGTQEETHVGASPECCPAVLVTPPLKANQALVVTGAEAMITVSGYGRNARCKEVLSPMPGDEHRRTWEQRTMLFMDALELDLQDRDAGLPDLHPGNVDRELCKAYVAFNSRSARPYPNIYTGYWGCGTFGGNVQIKALIQWCAASLAGCPLTFLCSKEGSHAFGGELEEFVAAMAGESVTAETLAGILRNLKQDCIHEGDSALTVVRKKVNNKTFTT